MKIAQILTEYVRKQDGKWVVLDHTKTKVLGKHDTRQEALQQLRAIEINKHKE